MKLNLGCGQNALPGYINVDKFKIPGITSQVVDLEEFPWPWSDNSADEVRFQHVLEHLGGTPKVFFGIMQNLYRVCRPDAKVHITVPHPRHDDFLNDPTHVRVITPHVMGLFSRENCLKWRAAGAANSPLALYLDVDFYTDQINFLLDEPYFSNLQKSLMSTATIEMLMRTQNNICKEIQMVLSVVK